MLKTKRPMCFCPNLCILPHIWTKTCLYLSKSILFTPHLDENPLSHLLLSGKLFSRHWYAPYGKESCQSNLSVCRTVNRIAIHKPKNLVHRRGDTVRPQRQAESQELVLVTLSALHPAFCLCCIQKNIAGYFVRSELFVIFACRFPYENINISYEENIIFH